MTHRDRNQDREQLRTVNLFWLPLCAALVVLGVVCVILIGWAINWWILAGQVTVMGGFLWLRRALKRRIGQ